MAYLGSCKICGDGTLDTDLCDDCKDIIATAAVAGEPYEAEEIKQCSLERKRARQEQQLAEQLEQANEMLSERELQKQVKQLKAKLDKAREDINRLKRKLNNCCCPECGFGFKEPITLP